MRKVIFIITLSFIIFSGITIKGVAAMLPSNIAIDGNFYKIVYTENNSHEYLKYLDMLPGNSVEKPLVVTNNTKYPFKVYLKSERVSAVQKPDLAEKLDLTIKYDNKLLYSGNVLGSDQLKKGICLGTVNPGERKVMDAKVVLNPNTGKEYSNKQLEIKWIFTAVGDHGNEITTGNNGDSTLDKVAKELGINIPKTGFTGMYQYGIPLIIIGGILYAVGKTKKRRRGECE